MKANVRATDLMAAMNHVSTDESHPILTAVHIEVKDKVVTLVATDSYRLVVMTSEDNEAIDGEVNVALGKMKLDKKRPVIIESDGETVTIDQLGTKTELRAIQGNYPNYERLLPEPGKFAEQVTNFAMNIKYITEMGKSYELWSGEKNAVPTFEFVGEAKPVYTFAGDGKRSFTGLIMPVRTSKTHLEQPEKGEEPTKYIRQREAQLEQQLKEEKAKTADLEKQLEEAKSVKEQIREHIAVVDATPKVDDARAKIDTLIAEFETIRVAGETSCAVYFEPTVKAHSPEMEAIKAAGGKWGNHKKYGKCWYMPR